MRRLGIIGGISWHSTAKYYEQLNAGIQSRLGGHHSADVVIHSLNFAEVERLQRSGDWKALGLLMRDSATALAGCGAEGLLIGANTMHKTVPALAEVDVEVLHIADALARSARRQRISRLGLLGTRFTMGESFLKDALAQRGLQVEIPPESAQAEIDEMIFGELVHGEISHQSHTRGLQIIEDLGTTGCQGVALACTELGIPQWQPQTTLPLIDSQRAHVEWALDWMLGTLET